MFVIQSDINENNSTIKILFNKKQKQIWQFTDPNASSFSYNKIELFNLRAHQKYKLYSIFIFIYKIIKLIVRNIFRL